MACLPPENCKCDSWSGITVWFVCMPGIDVDDVSVIIILILWAAFSKITAMIVDKIGI